MNSKNLKTVLDLIGILVLIGAVFLGYMSKGYIDLIFRCGEKMSVFLGCLSGFLVGILPSSSLFIIGSIAADVQSIKEMLYKQINTNNKIQSNPISSQSNPDNNRNNDIPTINKLQAINNGESVPDKWVCKNCGEVNDRLSDYCKGCGKFK